MKYGKIYTYENRNEAEIGKEYVFSDLYNDLYRSPETRVHSVLKAVEDTGYPFMNCYGYSFQLIREVIEEEPALMTYRQLAEWLRELKALRDFANFVAESVTEEEFEENSGFYAEVYCRKLHKMGFIEATDDKWIF